VSRRSGDAEVPPHPSTDIHPSSSDEAAAATERRSGAELALRIVVAGWIVILVMIIRHRVFVSHDSISNYGHVWYVSEQLWGGHGLPFRMPVIGHGAAYAFPYGFLPWATAALFHPLFGDWVVTLWLVLGSIGVILTTFWAFPELRRGWWAAAALANPAVVTAAIIGQLPFLWAMTFLLAGIGCWRSDRRWQAAILVGLAQATHPAIVLPIGLALVVAWLPWERHRGSLLRWYALSMLITLPAVWIVFVSPVFIDASTADIVLNFFGTFVARMLVVFIPVALILFRRLLPWPWVAPTLFAVLIGVNLLFLPVLSTRFAWGALRRKPDTTLLQFIHSPKFEKDATYRILRTADGKIGMYQLVRNGGRLDSEFFPESIHRRSYADLEAYSRFLRTREVEYVIVFDDYDRRYHTNEHRLLQRLADDEHPPRCTPALVGASTVAHEPQYDVYSVRREC
jgi:hypothetical protein